MYGDLVWESVCYTPECGILLREIITITRPSAYIKMYVVQSIIYISQSVHEYYKTARFKDALMHGCIQMCISWHCFLPAQIDGLSLNKLYLFRETKTCWISNIMKNPIMVAEYFFRIWDIGLCGNNFSNLQNEDLIINNEFQCRKSVIVNHCEMTEVPF